MDCRHEIWIREQERKSKEENTKKARRHCWHEVDRQEINEVHSWYHEGFLGIGGEYRVETVKLYDEILYHCCNCDGYYIGKKFESGSVSKPSEEGCGYPEHEFSSFLFHRSTLEEARNEFQKRRIPINVRDHSLEDMKIQREVDLSDVSIINKRTEAEEQFVFEIYETKKADIERDFFTGKIDSTEYVQRLKRLDRYLL